MQQYILFQYLFEQFKVLKYTAIYFVSIFVSEVPKIYTLMHFDSETLWRCLPWLFLHTVIFLKFLKIFFCSQNIFFIIFYELSSTKIGIK